MNKLIKLSLYCTALIFSGLALGLDYTCPPTLGDKPCQGQGSDGKTTCPNPIINQSGTKFMYNGCSNEGCSSPSKFVFRNAGSDNENCSNPGFKYKSHFCMYKNPGSGDANVAYAISELCPKPK